MNSKECRINSSPKSIKIPFNKNDVKNEETQPFTSGIDIVAIIYQK